MICLATGYGHAQQHGEVSLGKIIPIIVYKIAKRIDWPNDELALPGEFNIITLGNPPKDLDFKSLANIKLHNRKVIVRHLKMNELNAVPCDLLIIFDRNITTINKALNLAKQHNCVTIGQGGSFINQGGMIGLILRKETLNYEINLLALKQGDFKIAELLLSSAIRIKRTK